MIQTSPAELHRSIRFIGDDAGVCAMAAVGVETVSVAVDAFADTDMDFFVPFNYNALRIHSALQYKIQDEVCLTLAIKAN